MPNLSSVNVMRLTRCALLFPSVLVLAPLRAQTTPSTTTPPAQASTAQTYAEPALPGPTTPGPGNVTTPTATLSATQQAGRVGAMAEHDFSADLKDGATGNMSVSDFEIFGNYAYRFSDRDQLTLGADYLYRDYDFRGTGSPFGDVQQAGINAWYAHDIDNQWGAFGYIYGGFAAEKAVSFGDGGQVAVGLGPTVKITPELNLAFGPMFYTRPGDDVTWALVANMDWAFLPQWNLHLYAGISDGATVTYDVFDDHTTVLDASLEFNDFWFRVQDAPGGTERGVVARDVTLRLGVRQALGKMFFVRGYVSAIFDRRYQFHANDHSTNSFEVDPTAGVGAEFGVTF